MQLLESWKESLRFFERKNLILFGLVTLKAIKTVYIHMMRQMGVVIFLFILLAMNIEPWLLKSTAWWGLLFWAARMAFLAYVYATVRPSVTQKNWLYYWNKLGSSGTFVVIALVLFVLFRVSALFGYWLWPFFTLFATFAVFFYLDSVPGFKNFIYSWIKACKMILYNMPVCIAAMVLLLGLWFVFMFIIGGMQYIVSLSSMDAVCLFIPFEASILSNLYIKWLHEQFRVYYQKTLNDGAL